VTSNTPAINNWHSEAQRVAHGIRRRVLEHTINNNGGYLSQACSSAETFSVLYTRVMNLGPGAGPMVPEPFQGVPGPQNPGYQTGARYNGPKAPDLDQLIFSPAHYALVLYATLIEVGRMGAEGLKQFNQDGSTVEMIGAEHSPGVETTTGSLGQALSQAGGIALARKLRGDAGRVWVYMTDGEFQEGQTWEAFQVLSHYKLDNLGVYVDVNAHQCDGLMTDVMTTEPIKSRLETFGARVFEVDGHDLDALAAPAELKPDGRPLVVLARTNTWQGMDFLRQREPKMHYVRFQSNEERQIFSDELERLFPPE
jgi:transketolase